MRLKSRILALILCVVMAFSLVVTVSAQESDESDSNVQTMASKQTLDVILLMGQSNAEGLVDSQASSYDTARRQSVVCDEDNIFSTVVPINSGGRYTTGCSFSTLASTTNTGDYIAKSLSSNVSRNGNTLEYPLNSLSKNGAGKSGADSGLAYEWNKLTGDATWIVNITYSGSKIEEWQPGESNYEIALAAIDNVMTTYNSETSSSGNYSAGNVYMVWMQGETDCSSGTSVSDYESMFTTFYNGIKSEINKYASFKGCGFITIRSSRSQIFVDSSDLEDISARVAQVNLANNNSDITIASDANEDWVSDSGVNNYFMSWYPNGIDYPTHAAQITRPTTPYEVHPTIHYSQIGHNENGITAARGLYNVFYAKTASSGSTKGTIPNGIYQPTDSNTDIVETTYSGATGWWYTVNGVVDTSFTGFAHNTNGWWYVKNGRVQFNDNNCVIYGTVGGTYGLWYVDGSKVQTDQNGILDQVASDGNWYYVVNGKVDVDYNGVADHANINGWYYVRDGKVDFSFTGMAENVNGWWYCTNGQVTFGHTGLYDGVVNGISGTWYVIADAVQTSFCGFYNGYFINNGLVDMTYTSVTTDSEGIQKVNSNSSTLSPRGIVYTNDYGYAYYKNGGVDTSFSSVERGTVDGEDAWWYIENGKVNKSYTGVSNYENDYGWWYLKDGKVDFSFTGFASNKYGWWYVEGGQVKFNQNTVLCDTEGAIDGTKESWWYVVGSKVQTDYTGVCDYSNSAGWWYVENGKVDFSKNSVEQNSYGWWYVIGGKVDFSFTGLANYANAYGWWYIVNGQVDFTHNGVEQNEYGWWYVVEGKVQFGYTGVADYQNDYGWWYITNGAVDFSYIGFGKNSYGWWYCDDSSGSGGKVNFSMNSVLQDTHGAIDGDTDGWWYVLGGKVQTTYGDESYTGVTDISNGKGESSGYWYVVDGKVNFGYTGFGKNSYGWWYVENGEVIFGTNNVIKDSYGAIDGTVNSWWYVVDGQVQTTYGNKSYTGVANYANGYGSGWWYIVDGKVDFSYTGLAMNNYGWWKVEGGEVNFSYKGFAYSYAATDRGDHWGYCIGGHVYEDEEYNDIILDSNNTIGNGNTAWYYVDHGWVYASYTGVGNFGNTNGWWYIKNGQVDFSYTGFGHNNNGWWWCEGGKVIFQDDIIEDTLKVVDGTDSWYYCPNGCIDFTYTNKVSDFSNTNGWWYIVNGKVDFSYTGWASNSWGTWYVVNGKVDFSKS